MRHARVKRTFDIAAAVVFLAALIPLFVLIAAAIKLDSRGPVFFRVRRVGHRGMPLMMLKFRKMHHDASGLPLTGEQDPRLTRVGRVLAAARLDELPQFWDVLRGRMSIVGPRPEDPGFVSLHDGAYERILRVRPGITGLSQLAFAEERAILNDEDPVSDYIGRILPQKIGLDTLYAESHSIFLDFAVLRWTVVATMLRKPVAVHRATGRMNVRRPRPQNASRRSGEPQLEGA
jgi:lipopolysaccharide/colanic/teichoic acid biosynthesis glycosyltransferase